MKRMEVGRFLANSNDNNAKQHSIIRLFFFIFIPLAALVTLLFYGLIAIDNQLELVTLKERELGQAQVAARLLELENQQVVSDLMVISHSPAMKRYLTKGDPDEKNRLMTYFSNLINEKQSYDHIFFLDHKGNEIIIVDRINGKPIIKNEPGNHAEQDFFVHTSHLNKNQIYISPLFIIPSSTNRNALVNFGLPLFDTDGNKRGSIIYSLSGEKLIKNFNTAMQGKHSSLLINKSGTWVNKEGYIDINDLNSDQNFAKSYNREWNIIQNSTQGSFETNKGLFVFTTLYPLLSSKSKAEASSEPHFQSDNGLSGKDYYWKIVSFIPKSELPHFSLIRHPKTLGFYLLSLSLVGTLAAYLAYALAQRREILRKLQHYAAEANDLYEHSPVGYHSLDGKGTYVRINATELKWLGYSREEVVGKMRITDLLTPTGLRVFNEQFPKFKEKGFVHDLEFELIRKDGSQFTVLLNATAIYDKNHNYLASRSIMVDITRRKQIEYALRESEERFRNTMDNAPIGMATISIEGKFIRVNETLARVLGYDQSELEETSIQDITYPADINADEMQIHELKAGKISHYKCEKRFIRKNGEVIWVQLTSSAVRSNLRSPLYYVAQIEDISERKIYQESVHHLAYHDTLTNLPNRRLFYDELDKAIHTATLSNQSLAVMYVDIDYFKSINDTLGHDIGDELLKVVAARLTGEVRDTDIVSRTGGDEFVILLAKISSYKDAELIANSIINSLRVPIYLRDTKLKVTVSIGIAIFPQDATQAKILMKQADKAMYAAKNAGKDQYLTYSDCKDSVAVDPE